MSAVRGLRGFLLAGLVVLVALSATTVAEAEPATEWPGLRLVAWSDEPLVFERTPGDGVWLELGTYLVADGGSFEVRTRRAGYDRPIVAHQVVGRGPSRHQVRRLPDGLAEDFTGFAAFTHVTITDTRGGVVAERDETFCAAGGPTVDPPRWAVPVDADAPASSPYPHGCPRHPFALGAVWGLQVGWGAPSANAWYSQPADLADGAYTAKIRVKQPFRDLFSIPAGQASATVRFSVRTATTANSASPGSELVGRPGPGRGVAGHGAHGPAGSGAAAGPGQPATGPGPIVAPPAGARVAAPADAAAGADRGGRRWRPDLRPLPAFAISLDAGGPRELLTFSATVWNAGTSPLDVQGTRRPGTDVMDAVQQFYDPGGRPSGTAPVGTFEWDPRTGHEHWHFIDFAAYRLLHASGQVAVSQKQAFCVGNTGGVDTTLPVAAWQPVVGFDPVCGTADAQTLHQRLDVGWGDTYIQNLPGQAIDVTDLPNGSYQLEVVVNPNGTLRESDTGNNTVRREIELVGKSGQRVVLVPPHHGIDA